MPATGSRYLRIAASRESVLLSDECSPCIFPCAIEIPSWNTVLPWVSVLLLFDASNALLVFRGAIRTAVGAGAGLGRL